MSVPYSQRTQGKLAVVTKARELRTWTIHICSNEKNFPKRYRWCVTNKIVEDTNELCKLIIMANAVKVDNSDDKRRRLERQKMALELTESLLDMVTVAYETFHVKTERVELWTAQLTELQNLLRGWIRSDSERYKDIG